MRNGVCLGNGAAVRIGFSAEETPAVLRAVDSLAGDVRKVFGCAAEKDGGMRNVQIIAGTIGVNRVITEMAESGALDAEPIRGEGGAYRWEGYLLQEKDGILYLCGADRRGTVFAIYDFCRRIGVSPWYFFADVPVRRRDAFWFEKGFYAADYPSVQYRGIFLNDEEELDAWAGAHTPDGTIGPVAYEKIFELLLRLKANYIWPAMHVNCFNGNPRNAELADEMGIVVGTSHCDMLLRSNQNEWRPWLSGKGYRDVKYDYSIPGRNREIIREYWKECVEQNGNYEVCYTVGMRGIHDSGFATSAIDADPSLGEEEKRNARVRLLGGIIRDQRAILKEVLGGERGGSALQTFIPYKEVLNLYDAGLDIPDDITLIWADDNYGYMRRFPSAQERRRAGGHGLYYHSSYWAPRDMSYLFINSTPLAHTGVELEKSYLSGIRKIWVLNVGALKPLEQDIEFFLQYGWEARKVAGLTKDAHAFTKTWIDGNFSGSHGEEAAELYDTFAQATNVRKLEHMDSGVFSQASYGDEAGRRLGKLEDIFRRGNEICLSLPEEERDAFFQLFLMKIQASYYVNHEFYYADRSALSYRRGNMRAADLYIGLSRRMLEYKREMLDYYNHRMCGGKWEKILTPEAFPPPCSPLYPAGKPTLRIGKEGMRVFLWDGGCADNGGVLRFYQFGARRKWFEIGNQGAGAVEFSIRITGGGNWLRVSETSGAAEAEKRVFVTVEDPAACAGKKAELTILDRGSGEIVRLEVCVEENIGLPKGFCGAVEAESCVLLDAESFCARTGGAACGWAKADGIGRYAGSAMMAYNHALCALSAEPGLLEENPFLEYRFYLRGSARTLEIERFLTLNSTGKIRLGIGIDGRPPIVVESEIRDEWLGQWRRCVMNDGERLPVELPALGAGAHTLRVYMIDNFVTFSRLFLYAEGAKRSNLGPIGIAQEAGDEPVIDWKALGAFADGFYRMNGGKAPLPDAVYAGRDFWSRDVLYAHNVAIPQQALGARRYAGIANGDGAKDVPGAFGEGCFAETGGVIAIEAEYALADTRDAYLTPDATGKLNWSHLQAETNGRTGLAMRVEKPRLLWDDPAGAPGMHYRIRVGRGGVYHAWLLVYFPDDRSDSCCLAVDGNVQPLDKQYSRGKLFTYRTIHIYHWNLISDVELTEGEHTFSILARKSMLRVDRIYLTQGDELPPADAGWADSPRRV